ncbi:phage tail length tape measure family protein [Ancylobacter sp.]|uniref:phage tail length tape measure family protein n=1 Tax=Ancylobacter sp. TaxID=1872567 RepID=UPI003D0B4B97
MAVTVEKIRRVVTQYESRGADKSAADLNVVAAAQGNVAQTGATMATVTDTVTKRQLDAGKAADTVRRKYDEEYRTLQTLAREHQKLDRALQTGRLTAEEYARTLDLMHARYGVVAQAQAEMARRVQQEAKAISEAAAAQQRYNALLGVQDNFGTDARAADIAAAGNEIQRLREKYLPLAAVQRRYLETLQEINQAAKVGILTEVQRADAISRTKTAFAEQVVVIRGLQQAGHTLSSFDLSNLSFQVNDIITMLAMGAPPMQVFASQAGQIYQILANQQGGLIGGMRALGGTMSALVTPTGLAVTALAAVGVTALAAYASWVAGEKQLQAALQGRGRATQATVDDLKAIAVAAAEASDATVGESRAIVAALASTGKIGTDFYSGLVDATKRYAAVTQQELGAASTEMAEAFANPAKGAETLNEKLLFLDGSTIKYIRDLSTSNRTHEAAAVLLQRLTQALPAASSNLTLLGRAWLSVKDAASGAYTAIGQGIDRLLSGPSLEERIGILEKQLADLDAGQAGAGGRYGQFGNARVNLEKTINAELSRLYAERATIQTGQVQAERNLLDSEARAIVGSRDPRIQQLADLQKEQSKVSGALREGVGDTDAQQRALEGLTNQIGKMTDAYGNLIPQAEIVRREQELQNNLLVAVTPAQRAAASAALERYRAEAEGADSATAAAKASAAAQQEMLQAQVQMTLAGRHRLLSAQESNAAQDLEAQLIGKTAGEVATLRANYAAYWDLKREAIDNGTEVDQRQLDLLKAQNAELGRKVELTARAQLMADIQFERDQLGRGTVDQQIASTLRSAGLKVDLDSADASALRLNATLSITRDIAGDALSGFARDILDGADAMTALENAAKRALDVILDMAMQNLAASLFGPGTGGSNILGSIVSAFTGGGSAGVGSHAAGGGLGAIYAGGGYTGSGGKYQAAGTVHRGEFVFSSEATRAAGVGSLDALHRGLRGYADGGGVGVMDALRHATGQASGNGRATPAVPKVTVNIHGAPAGASAQSSASFGADGQLNIDVIFDQFEGRMAENLANRRGALAPAMESSYRLDPMRGRGR